MPEAGAPLDSGSESESGALNTISIGSVPSVVKPAVLVSEPDTESTATSGELSGAGRLGNPSRHRSDERTPGAERSAGNNGEEVDDGAPQVERLSQRRRTLFRGDSADELLTRFASMKAFPSADSDPDHAPSADGLLRPAALQSTPSFIGNRSAPNLPSITDGRSESVGNGLDRIAEGREDSPTRGKDVEENSEIRPLPGRRATTSNFRLSGADEQKRANIAAAIDAAKALPPHPSILSPQHTFLLTSPLSSAGGPNPLDESLLSLNLGMFWQWVLCFCVVNFDLELGQALEYIYPPIDFSEDEKKNIAFSAFPDSNSSAHSGDNTFTFRMRSGVFTQQLYLTQQPPPLAVPLNGSLPRSRGQMLPNSQGAGLPVDTDGYTYGYVFFRQKRDAEIRRGFFQKSLVVLSPHPWPGLWTSLVGSLGRAYMDAFIEDRQNDTNTAKTLLEAACFDIAAWPAPPSTLSPEATYYSITLNLPFVGKMIRCSFPPTARFPQLFESQILNPFDNPKQVTLCCPGRFYDLFARSLEMLWTCWELMVIGEPILVVGESPKGCSDVVWSLIELIKPIPYGGDFRPYFTIQDSDFKGIGNRIRPPPSATVLGATNPVFTKVLEHWPHVAKVGRAGNGSCPAVGHAGVSQSGSAQSSPRTSQERPQSQSPVPSMSNMKSILSFGKSPKMERAGSGSNADLAGRERTEAFIESIATKHKPFLMKDKKLIKEVVESSIRGKAAPVLDNMLRRHFMDLTERFLQPLTRHYDGCVIGNPMQIPEMKPFQQDSFLKTIEQTAPNLPVPSRRSISDLYRQFLKSPNFAAWLQHRTSEVYREWRRRYLDVLCESDMEGWAKGRMERGGEVEVVDLLLRIRDELTKYAPYFIINDDDNTIQYTYPPGTDVESSTSPGRSRSVSVPPPRINSYNSPTSSPKPVSSPLATSPTPPLSSLSTTTSPTSSPSTGQKGEMWLDLSGAGVKGLMATVAGSGHNGQPASPGPVGVMGGVVPKKEQYAKLRAQVEVLVRILPEDLRGSLGVGGVR
ncbi:Protein dennd6a [Rhizophlyctis rosea]|nr:Protein dennd6a [Rhizophlyctis rosea]